MESSADPDTRAWALRKALDAVASEAASAESVEISNFGSCFSDVGYPSLGQRRELV